MTAAAAITTTRFGPSGSSSNANMILEHAMAVTAVISRGPSKALIEPSHFGALSSCFSFRHVPPKNRSDETAKQDECMAAGQQPVLPRCLVSLCAPVWKAPEHIHEQVTRDCSFPLGQTEPEDAAGVDEQVDRNGACDDVVEHKFQR